MKSVTVPLLLFGLVAWAPAAAAQDARTGESPASIDQRTQSISSQIMSPFCPGRTLSECPSPSAAEWRADIRGMVAEGMSGTEIREQLEARAPGADLSGDPGTSSDSSVVHWIILGTLVPVLALVLLLRIRRKGGGEDGAAEEPEATADPQLDARLDEELRALES